MLELTRRSLLIGVGGVALGAALTGCSPSREIDVIRTAPLRPRSWARTSWSRDPFALGSYSYLAPSNLGPSARTMLAEPVGRLVFAGEATSSTAPATTHGALQSGRDAAELIMDETESGETVIVVGAGFAGLGAARALTDAGFEVIVVEARDRVGGRATTVELDGYPVDLGPSWIHGVTGNPMAKLASDSGTKLNPFDYENSEGATTRPNSRRRNCTSSRWTRMTQTRERCLSCSAMISQAGSQPANPPNSSGPLPKPSATSSVLTPTNSRSPRSTKATSFLGATRCSLAATSPSSTRSPTGSTCGSAGRSPRLSTTSRR